MTQDLLHTLGELFGIQNYTPPSPTQAHFSLASNGMTYILDAELTKDTLLLCLSRPLLAHEENDTQLCEKAARVAHEHNSVEAHCQNAFLSFLCRVPLNAHLSQVEENLLRCISCQNAVREG